MKKLIGAATIVAAGMSIGGTAFAGEVTGGPNPKGTPIGEYTAGSICSFSGQNDVPEGDQVPIDPENDPDGPTELDPFSVGRVQSWGQTLNLAAGILLPPDTKGKKGLVDSIHEFGPGASCRGYASGGGGEP